MDKKKICQEVPGKYWFQKSVIGRLTQKNKQKALLVIKEALHNNKMNNFLGRYMDSGLLCT